MRVLITRPESRAGKTAAKLKELGHEVARLPLFTPVHDRAAAEAACAASAIEISRLRLQSHITFVDDCRQPKVTPVFNRPGHVIVTRVVEIQTSRGTARKTYSALMDGRPTDAWRMVQVDSAPNELSVVYGQPSLAHSEEAQEPRSSPSLQSH